MPKCTRLTLPARIAVTACRNWSHDCSHSTIRPVPVLLVTVWVLSSFDPAKVVVNAELSLTGGAIRGWDKRNFYYYQMLQSLAKHYEFKLSQPFNELPDDIREKILFGSGKEEIKFTYMNDRGDKVVRAHPFEGIIPNMQRRYRETESQAVRDELSKYVATQPCKSCSGTRLRTEARHVFIQGTTLPEVVEQSIGDALEFFQQLSLEGQRANCGKNSERD